MNLYDQFPSAALEDLRLYFKHTLIYTKTKEDADFVLRYVYDFAVDGNKIAIYLCDTVTAPVPFDVKEVDVEVRFPEAGYMNWRSLAVRITRKSRRQNQKGICASTLLVENPFRGLIASMVSTPFFKLMDKYDLDGNPFAQDGVGIITTYKQLLTSPDPISAFDSSWYQVRLKDHATVARAVSRKFAISKGMANEFPSLWYDGILVASSPRPDQIHVDTDDGIMFFQEVSDCFSPQGIQVTAR